MIKLLYAHSLTEKGRFQPESQPLTLNQRQSTARIVVGPAAPEIAVGDWMQDMDEPGAGIVWRVKSIDNQLETETRTIVLEHLINSLRDKLMFGEVKPEHMGGTASGCTAQQAVTYILNQQSDWVLGTFEYGSVSNPYAFNGDDLFSALETVSSSLEGCWWSYNFSSYPFTINMTHRASVVSTELRQMRNIQTAKYTIDKSRMYTRMYPIGKNNIHIDGNFVSRNENLYGIIEKTETDQSKATKAELQRWAEERIANHCEPSVTWTVQALDFSRETGESLDHIVLGAMCRMPLPGYDTVIEEIITQLNYPDKIRDREMCTVTLANIQEDVASIINNLIKTGGRGSRTSAKDAQEDHAWIEDTTDHVTLIAEAAIGKDGDNPVDWSRVAQLGVDGEGISGRVTRTEGDIITAQASITANENAITAEVTRATGAESSLSSQITVEAGKINQVVTAVGENGEVTAASICLAINQSGDSEAVINASKIYLLGQTIANTITANYIATKISSIASMLAQNITAQDIDAASVKIRPIAGMGAINVATAYNGSSLTLSGSTYTLRLAKMNGEYDEWTFNRATTLSAGWDGNRKFTVGASPQGVSRYTTLQSAIPNAQVTVDGTTATFAMKAYIDDSETPVDVGNITMNVANFLLDKTSTNKFTANGTYTAGTGYLGFGQIEIDVPQSGGATNVEVRFNGSSGSYYIEAFDSVSGNPITGANLTYKLGLNGTKVEIQNTSGTKIGADYQVPLQSSRTLTQNGTYTPSSGNIGIASVTVNVPSDLPNARARFNVSSGQYYIEAFDNVSTNPISGSTVNYKLGISSNKVQIQNTSGSKLSNTPEYDISSLLTNAGYAGRAAVTLNDPTWNTASGTPTSRTVTVTTAGRTDSSGTISNLSKSVALYLTQDSWSSNKKIVRMRAGSTSGTTYAQVEVDASSLVTTALNAGKAAVGISGASWSGNSSNVTSRTVSVNTTGRTNTSGAAANLTTSIGLYMTQSGWSGNSKTVYLREGANDGTIRAQVTVDATARYDAGVASVYGDYLAPVWGERYGDNYNANLYKTNGGSYVRKIYASANTGVHVPLSEDGANMNSEGLTEIPSGGVTANGNYKFRSGYAGIRYFSVNVPTSSASYSFSGISGGNNCPSSNVSGFLSGYTTHYVSVGSRQNQYYQYIKFAVDGRRHAFYF